MTLLPISSSLSRLRRRSRSRTVMRRQRRRRVILARRPSLLCEKGYSCVWLVGHEYEYYDHFMHGNRIVNKAVLRKVPYMYSKQRMVGRSPSIFRDLLRMLISCSPTCPVINPPDGCLSSLREFFNRYGYGYGYGDPRDLGSSTSRSMSSADETDRLGLNVGARRIWRDI